MWPEDDFMELGETGLIMTPDGFIEKETGRHIAFDEISSDIDDESNHIVEDEEE